MDNKYYTLMLTAETIKGSYTPSVIGDIFYKVYNANTFEAARALVQSALKEFLADKDPCHPDVWLSIFSYEGKEPDWENVLPEEVGEPLWNVNINTNSKIELKTYGVEL